MIDRRAAKIVEIVRENLGREADRDTLGTLEQHNGELRRQRDGLLRTTVVAELPVRRLRVEKHVLREIREARLDVSRRRRLVACEEIAVITLRLDEERALPNCHERGADGRVAVRVERHRATDDIGDLMKTPVVHVPQRMQNPALHRLQAVVDVRDGAVEDDVARVFKKPSPVTLRQRGIFLLHARTAAPRAGREDRRTFERDAGRSGCHRFCRHRQLSSLCLRRWRGRQRRHRRRRGCAVEGQLGLVGVFRSRFLGHCARKRLVKRAGCHAPAPRVKRRRFTPD